MTEAKYDFDADITLDSLDPPTQHGRTLRWSGEDGTGRVPDLGETVRWEQGSLGIVTGYFQAFGSVGVEIRQNPDDTVLVRLFGSEIDVTRAYAGNAAQTWRAASDAPIDR
jgi:hypothetical protein